MIKATTNTDINIPTPIPVLKIPPIMAQPENVVRSANNNMFMIDCVFI